MPLGFLSSAAQLLGSLLWSILESRIGQIAIAFVVGWVWAYWDTSSTWKARIEADKQAVERQYQAEIRRQQQAATEIARAATERAEEDQQIVDDLRRQIDEFNTKETTLAPAAAPKTLPRAPVAGCAIDRNFADVVRQLDRTPQRKSRAPRRTR